MPRPRPQRSSVCAWFTFRRREVITADLQNASHEVFKRNKGAQPLSGACVRSASNAASSLLLVTVLG